MLLTLLGYIPLSYIGLWRWSYWLVRIVGSRLYRQPIHNWPRKVPEPTISVVTPVYNENEALFKRALDSWIANGVNEIVAVIDKNNTHLIAEYQKRYVGTKGVTRCRLIVTPKPGKRAALCDGIERATGDLIALVDSDTVWGDNVRHNSLPLFLDEQIGGVTVEQRISNPDSVSNVLFDILLWTRYHEEVPFLLGLGTVFNTLSGRTAIYRREALLNPQYNNVFDLRHEHFFGTRGVSGDDKRLTHLILEQGWHVGLTKDAVVYTEGLNKTKVFLKQRLRWTRNSWRADLRAIKRGWVWQHPALAYFMIDRFIQPFLMLLGPIALVLALFFHHWPFAIVLVSWWTISRIIKLFGYFRLHPRRLIYLPAYIAYSYTNALIKIYALSTIIEHSWATRGHKTRKKPFYMRASVVLTGFIGTAIVLFALGSYLNQLANESAFNISTPTAVSTSDVRAIKTNAVPSVAPVLPVRVVSPTQVQTYTIKTGDSMASIAAKICMPIADLRRENNIVHPKALTSGQVLYYYCNSLN